MDQGAGLEGFEEETLIASAQAGSTDAAARLFELYWASTWQTALRITGNRALADEVAQDAMVAALERLRSFRAESSFRTWLFRIVVNRALNTLRTEERRMLREHAFNGRLAERIEEDVSFVRKSLAECVAALPESRRTVVVLRYWLDCTPDEISQLVGAPVGTIHSRLARGVAELRAALEVRDDIQL